MFESSPLKTARWEGAPLFEFLHLKGVQVGFKDRRPRFPVKVTILTTRGELEYKESAIDNGGLVSWETNIHIPSNSDVQVVVKESHSLKWLAKKEFASVHFTATNINIRESAIVTNKKEEGPLLVKLIFDAPVATGDVVRKEAEEAEQLLMEKPTVLGQLGRARTFIETARNLGSFIAGLHPAANAAIFAFEMLYKRLEKQEEIHEDAFELLEDLQLFLPFTEVVDPDSTTSEAARSAIRDFLVLFKETCEFIVQYSSTGVLGGLISSEGAKVDRLEKDFRKVKGRYDWSIKTDVWRSTLKLEKSRDDEILKLLQVSVRGPAGKEYFRTDRCCLEGTRTGVLEQVSQWAEFASGQKLFWMHGIAGCGKSAIANTVARAFDDQRILAGCFFCRRDDPDLRNAEKVIPSLAFHLAAWHQPYSAALLAVLQGEEKNKLASKTLQEQFELLIERPVLALSSDQQIQAPRPLIIVIDALDECGDNLRQRFQLAQVLVQVSQLVPWLKLFIASRPLPEFSQVFENAGRIVKKLHLNQVENPTADIELYTIHRAKLIAEENGLEPTWLSDEHVTLLTQKAQGLFVWTSTVFNFIQSQIDVQHALEVVLSSASTSDAENPEGALDDLYKMVLHRAGNSAHNLMLVKSVAGVIYSTAKNVPLTVDAIHALIPQISENVIGRVVDQLQAVLYRDEELQNAIRVCHPSFIDFMSQESRAAQFWTKPQDVDLDIGTKCLQIMKGSLCFNICHLETSYIANKDIPDLPLRIGTEVSKALSYSCLYWMSHVQGADVPRREDLITLIQELLYTEKALYWLEVLSLLQELKKGIRVLSQAIATFTNVELKAIALDLFRFVSAFYDPISTSTPHLYVSALAWLPSECLLARKIGATSFNKSPIRNGTSRTWPSTLLTIPESGMVRAVAYSSDGLHIASGTQEGVVCVRDAQTGNFKITPLKDHKTQITCVAFSPNGKFIAASSHDRTICIWDVETGVLVGGVLRIVAVITSITFTPDGKRIVSGSDDRMIRVWDVETRTIVGEPINGGPAGSIRTIAISPDGKYVASGLDVKVVQVVDLENGEPICELEGHTNWVVSLAFSRDGRYIASGSYDKTIRLWDAKTWKPLKPPFIGHTDYVTSVAFSPDAKLLVSTSQDKTIRIWDVEIAKALGKPLRGHTEWVLSVAFSPDGKHFVSGAHDKSVRVWDLEAGNYEEELIKGRVTCVAFSPDGRRVASGSTEMVVQLWDAETGKLVGNPLVGHSRWVNSVVFSNDGRYLVTGSDDQTVRIWDMESYSLFGSPLEGHAGWVKSIAFSPDGKKFASGSQDKTIRIWDAKTAKLVDNPLGGENDWINAVAFSPDEKHVAAGLDDAKIMIWDLDTKGLVRDPLTGHSEPVLSVVYSPDGKHIASGSMDGSVRVWNAETGVQELLLEITGVTRPIRSVAYSSDGKHIAGGSDKGLIQIWDTQTGKPVGNPYTGHTSRINCLTYSREGRIVSGSDDGTIRIWDADRTHAAQAAEIDGVPPLSVPNDGWIRTITGELLLWVPLEHRNGICDMCALCIPGDALGHPVRVEWRELCHGTSWAKVKRN